MLRPRLGDAAEGPTPPLTSGRDGSGRPPAPGPGYTGRRGVDDERDGSGGRRNERWDVRLILHWGLLFAFRTPAVDCVLKDSVCHSLVATSLLPSVVSGHSPCPHWCHSPKTPTREVCLCTLCVGPVSHGTSTRSVVPPVRRVPYPTRTRSAGGSPRRRETEYPPVVLPEVVGPTDRVGPDVGEYRGRAQRTGERGPSPVGRFPRGRDWTDPEQGSQDWSRDSRGPSTTA